MAGWCTTYLSTTSILAWLFFHFDTTNRKGRGSALLFKLSHRNSVLKTKRWGIGLFRGRVPNLSFLPCKPLLALRSGTFWFALSLAYSITSLLTRTIPDVSYSDGLELNYRVRKEFLLSCLSEWILSFSISWWGYALCPLWGEGCDWTSFLRCWLLESAWASSYVNQGRTFRSRVPCLRDALS